MITIKGVKDWIKTFNLAEYHYIGKLDNKKEKSIGVYQKDRSGPPRMAIGGLDCTKYDVLSISVLVHWNDNPTETEVAANKLFEKLREVKLIEIDNHKVDYISLQVPYPQDVGTDEAGIYERVIWFDIYYERS